MYQFIILASASAVQPAPAAGANENIIVTASREPVETEDSPTSATIFTTGEIEALGLPLTSDILRLSPGVAIATTGPRGSQTQLRIRGAEANHTLLFVDGIRFNDPAAGNEGRFELLANDLLSRIELVRGPQSALWGSEALGGVVSLETANPLKDRGLSALAEYGSLESLRSSGQFAAKTGGIGLSGGVGWLRSDGIDSFGSGGERDGFDNLNANFKAALAPAPGAEIGASAHWMEGESHFDGYDPVTFRRADTLDSTKNRIGAIRGWGSLLRNDWSVSADVSFLDSANRNLLDDDPLNSTYGQRLSLGAQVSKRLGVHHLIAAIEHEGEEFRARDTSFGGFTNQDKSRDLTAYVAEWRTEWTDRFTTDVAVRHDSFSAFEDATTLRASALFKPAPQWALHAAYGEGIAQPTFYDLYGFFPGSFVGNPELRPERSEGWEAGFRWSGRAVTAGVTGFQSRLKDEILETFDPVTFLSGTANADERSSRKGVEFDLHYRLSELASFLVNYTFLDAQEDRSAGGAAVREVRRPRHSGNAALTGSYGPFGWAASIAYVGKRTDTDFDLFPASTVVLDDYVLGSLRLAYRVTSNVEAYARAESLFDADYQDVVGYNTSGRTIYAGLRLRLGR